MRRARAVMAAALLATGTAGTGGCTSGSSGPPAPGVAVTCTTDQGKAGQDRQPLLDRAKTLAHGTPTVSGDDNALQVVVPGATRSAVAGLCDSHLLELRPLLAPTVPVRDASTGVDDPLDTLPFDAPANPAGYDTLPPAERNELARSLARTDCAPAPGAGESLMIACIDVDGRRSAALLGAPVVASPDVTRATADASAGRTWTLQLGVTRSGSAAWQRYTAAHNLAGSGLAADPSNCGATGVPCADFAGVVLDGIGVSLPTIEAALPVGTPVRIAGSFTEAEAKDLAAQISAGPLPTALNLHSILPTR